jgi:hypothetical protein
LSERAKSNTEIKGGLGELVTLFENSASKALLWGVDVAKTIASQRQKQWQTLANTISSAFAWSCKGMLAGTSSSRSRTAGWT